MASSSLSSYKSSIESTGISLSKNFYLNKYYTMNHKAIKESSRKEFHGCELIYEDSRALKRAASFLSTRKYDDEENEDKIHSSLLAFKDTYNNAIDSGTAMNDRNIKKYVKKLESLIEEHKEDLEDIGIKIGDDKKLTVSEEILKNVDMEKIKKVFSKEDSDLLRRTTSLSKRILSASSNYIYSEITGNGLRLNITL